MYILTCRVQKMWLDKCLKSSVPDDPLTSNMGNGPRHCSKLNNRLFTVFIDPCENNYG